MSETSTLPEDPAQPGRDVLGSKLGNRGHFIGSVMWAESRPMHPGEIGELAKPLAEVKGGRIKPNTYSTEVTRNHLRWMREHGYAEQTREGLWQLTDLARKRIQSSVGTAPPPQIAALVARNGYTPPEVRVVDPTSRVLLPRQFANATVMVEMVGESEVRIRKAVVVPEASLPTIEDALPPLPDEDRDFFLNLIDNPPEPNAAFRRAARHYKKWHGRSSDRTSE